MIAACIAFSIVPFGADAVPVTSDGAARVASEFAVGGERLGSRIGRNAAFTTRHVVRNGSPFYSVRMHDEGTVFVAESDGRVIAFTTNSVDFASLDEQSPMRALLERDSIVRANIAALTANNQSPYYSNHANRIDSVDDVRVAPLVKSMWSQSSAGGHNCYNYCTPKNYYCGCTATALAQIMRFFEYPISSVPSVTRECYVDNVSTNLTTQGGIYEWSKMTLVPNDEPYSEESWSAIGKLTSDVGIVLGSSYASGGTGVDPDIVERAFTDVFGYADAIRFSSDDVFTEGSEQGVVEADVGLHNRLNRQNTIGANLDAGLPVMLGIYGYKTGRVGDDNAWAGHAVVGDGYGYCDVNGEKVPYVHLNLGWAGADDAWYNVPEICTSQTGATVADGSYDFTVFYSCVCNIFTNKTGEIVSGRVLTQDGMPVIGAEVFVENGTHSTVSNEKGIYSFVLPSNSRVTIAAASAGVTGRVDVVLGRSTTPSATGNRWGQDVVLDGRLSPTNFYVSAATGEDTRGHGSFDLPYATIQYAVTNGVKFVSGDIIYVLPGLYHGTVETPKESVSIISTDGPDTTIIDGDGLDCCYCGSDNVDNLFAGFTLTNGYNNGGVFEGAVSNCIICMCTSLSQYGGGGAFGARIYDSVLYGNQAYYGGGAASSTLVGCTVYDNWANDAGGGVDCNCAVTNSIIWRNTAGRNDEPDNYEMIYNYRFHQYVTPSFAYCCTTPDGFADLGGNTTNDPCFVSLDIDDWRLRAGSPCLGTAHGGGNMGAWQGEGLVGHYITVELDGRGTVTPWGAFVLEGDNASFAAIGDHPFLGFATNGVFATASRNYIWPDVRADGTLSATFGKTNYYVNAVIGNDDNDGFSTSTPLKTIYRMVQRAGRGDKAYISPGVYEGCNWCVRGVEVVSTDGPHVTIVDGDCQSRCLYGEGMIYRGFTLRNGRAETSYGAGAYGGTYVDCIISNCTAALGGGVAYASLTNCLVVGNSAQRYRSGMQWRGGSGGGAYECELVNCTLAGNSAYYYGGGAFLHESGSAVNTIVASNTSTSGSDYGNDAYGNAYWTMVNSLSDVDAKFRDAPHGDYRIKPTSPAFDAGSLDVALPDNDLAGAGRLWGKSVDVGCYEYHLTDSSWVDPNVCTNDTDATVTDKVIAAAKCEGFSNAISESLVTLADYAYLLEWAGEHNVSRAVQNASPTGIISAALGADGLLELTPEDIMITEFKLSSAKWDLSVNLPGYEKGATNTSLLRAAIGLIGSETVDGEYSESGLSYIVNPSTTGADISLVPPSNTNFFLRAVIR